MVSLLTNGMFAICPAKRSRNAGKLCKDGGTSNMNPMYMTLKDHVLAVLSEENKTATRMKLGINRDPTVDELVDNYTSGCLVLYKNFGIESDQDQQTLFV